MFARPCALLFVAVPAVAVLSSHAAVAEPHHHHHEHAHVEFDVRSVGNGPWSDAKTWKPARVPKAGDRVLIARGTRVEFDVESKAVVRLVQVAGTLAFATDRDTELNVGLLTIRHDEMGSESGFACEFEGADEGPDTPAELWPTLLVGTPEKPIPAEHTARIRLHFLEGMNKEDAPAIACCSGRMELHGSPLSRTWVDLGDDVAPGDETVTLSERVTGWRVGDEVIVTGSKHGNDHQTESRRITAIDETKITLDEPCEFEHFGTGEFRSEVANLSRNVVVESADPNGVRGHTVFHKFSKGGISYARFAHLGKRGVLGRYPIHYHLVGDTMRGSSVLGAAIVDSHNRWVTVHGTHYLLVRDCVGYRSIGHGYFLEDATETYNLLDRNLGVQAVRGKRLPKQVLPFDPNDGAAFWWSNGRNSLVRNVACENEEYGFRYDMQHSRYFDANLTIPDPSGGEQTVDVRTIPLFRFDGNETHTEGLYGVVIAGNGNSQPDSAITSEKSLERYRQIDWTGPDTRHPHVVRNLDIWQVHYGMRPHCPSMLMENVRIDHAAYGIYRPCFDNHVYRNLSIAHVGAEPFNRGGDDASAQHGTITVDGLTFATGYGNGSTPLVQLSDVNLSGDAESHFRNVTVNRPERFSDRWPLFNRGVGPRVPPITKEGVPCYVHDHFGPGRHAKVVSTAAESLVGDGNEYSSQPSLTGNEAVVAEVSDVAWPELLDPVDDTPPATMILAVERSGKSLRVRGISHDDGAIESVTVNGRPANRSTIQDGVQEWSVSIPVPANGTVTAAATDDAGNVEKRAHRVAVDR